MSQLLQFFDDDPSSFGFFYPKDHVLMSFPDLDSAERAARTLAAGDYTSRKHLVVSGQGVLEAYRELREQDDGWLDRVKKTIAKGVGTEQGWIDDDILLAEKGGAFLVVQCKGREELEQLRPFVDEVKPLTARFYTMMAIEDLIGEGYGRYHSR